MVKNVKPTAAVSSTSSGVFRWSASAPVGPVQPALANAAHGVVHHLPRGAGGAGHLADRLLREDRLRSRAGSAHGLDMTRRGQADPVAEPKLGHSPRVTQAGWRSSCSWAESSVKHSEIPRSIHFDDGLDDAGLGPGVRREDAGQLVETRPGG